MPPKLPAKIKSFDLWRWDGTIDRLPYLAVGVTLIGIKYGIDLFVAKVFFHRSWEFWNYFFPGGIDLLDLTQQDRLFYLTLIILSMPFIWIGVVLTMRRLRAVQLPVPLVKLFFIPFVNMLLFALLCILPNQELEPLKLPANGQGTQTEDGKLAAAALTTRTKGPVTGGPSTMSDAVYALVSTVPACAFLLWLSTFTFQGYGWSLFIGLPFVIGMTSAYLFGRREPRTIGACLAMAAGANTLLGLTIFLYAWEGIFCILMAAPLGYGLALMGGILGYNMQKRVLPPGQKQLTTLALLLIVFPALMGAEYAANRQAPITPVVSTVEIAAPPCIVWRYVIGFPELPPPTEPVFKLGIAYPIGATIKGRGAHAIRKCHFSTGAFIEPIRVWDEPHLLKFGVIAQPEPMREFNFIREIHPAHLHGYLNVESGQFKLDEIHTADGGIKTRLEGITWYQNQMWPNTYWRLWSDYMIHNIHMRVIKHIKKLAEARAAAQ